MGFDSIRFHRSSFGAKSSDEASESLTEEDVATNTPAVNIGKEAKIAGLMTYLTMSWAEELLVAAIKA